MSRGPRSTADMVRTMLVLLGAVALLVLLVPRPSSVPPEPVDLAQAVPAAREVLGYEPAAPVPPGWTVTSARIRRDTGDLPSWTVNYLTAQGGYVGLVQADGWSERWQDSLTHGGAQQGDEVLAGRTWERFEMPERRITSLLNRSGQATTLVLVKEGGLDDATTLASLLPDAP